MGGNKSRVREPRESATRWRAVTAGKHWYTSEMMHQFSISCGSTQPRGHLEQLDYERREQRWKESKGRRRETSSRTWHIVTRRLAPAERIALLGQRRHSQFTSLSLSPLCLCSPRTLPNTPRTVDGLKLHFELWQVFALDRAPCYECLASLC